MEEKHKTSKDIFADEFFITCRVLGVDKYVKENLKEGINPSIDKQL